LRPAIVQANAKVWSKRVSQRYAVPSYAAMLMMSCPPENTGDTEIGVPSGVGTVTVPNRSSVLASQSLTVPSAAADTMRWHHGLRRARTDAAYGLIGASQANTSILAVVPARHLAVAVLSPEGVALSGRPQET
jgi:hypothetical protein